MTWAGSEVYSRKVPGSSAFQSSRKPVSTAPPLKIAFCGSIEYYGTSSPFAIGGLGLQKAVSPVLANIA